MFGDEKTLHQSNYKEADQICSLSMKKKKLDSKR